MAFQTHRAHSWGLHSGYHRLYSLQVTTCYHRLYCLKVTTRYQICTLPWTTTTQDLSHAKNVQNTTFPPIPPLSGHAKKRRYWKTAVKGVILVTWKSAAVFGGTTAISLPPHDPPPSYPVATYQWTKGNSVVSAGNGKTLTFSKRLLIFGNIASEDGGRFNDSQKMSQ